MGAIESFVDKLEEPLFQTATRPELHHTALHANLVRRHPFQRVTAVFVLEREAELRGEAGIATKRANQADRTTIGVIARDERRDMQLGRLEADQEILSPRTCFFGKPHRHHRRSILLAPKKIRQDRVPSTLYDAKGVTDRCL